MIRVLFSLALILPSAVYAQAPAAVPVSKEPHHHLVFENNYVRVYRVSIPGHDSTLVHQHDLPYIYVSLGPADLINAVQGKPEAHLVMADGQVGYSPGGFAHVVHTDAGMPFNNVTIELLKPQGAPHNRCAQVAPGAGDGDCPRSFAKPTAFLEQPLFENGNTTVSLGKLAPNAEAGLNSQLGRLFVFLGDAETQIQRGNPTPEKVAQGDVIWVLAGLPLTIRSPMRKEVTFAVLSFAATESVVKPH